MEIPPKDLVYIISLASLLFLVAPIFLILYVVSYNSKKKKILIERENMRMSFETELLKAGMEVSERTMQTIGTDLHDNLGQLLSLMSLTLASIDPSIPGKTEQKITTVKELVGKSIQELRQLGKLIQGDQLVQDGLPNAIKYELNRVEKSGTFKTAFSQTGAWRRSHDKELILFRLFQEGLTNIIKHSHGNTIDVNLENNDNRVSLRMVDNGRGFHVEEKFPNTDGMGLLNMKRRAAVVGGTIRIDSQPGEGTAVLITIPYP